MSQNSESPHIPVLLADVMEAIEPHENMLIMDATFGAGGYSRAFLQKGADVIALDRDPDAIAAGQAMVAQFAPHLTLIQSQFSQLDQVSDKVPDAIVMDIGVSSMQLDQAQRGFSFMRDGPLDMRMSQIGPSAADVVARLKANELSRLFHVFGEERHAGRIARMIVEKREIRPFTTTLQLANAIESVIGRGVKDTIHPATRVFQALRIYVNDELGELIEALFAAERLLKSGGKLAIVTFHSLEDRIVKRFFNDRSSKQGGSRHLPQVNQKAASFSLLFKGTKTASDAEIAANPRARSARLRVGVRTDSAAHAMQRDIFGLPKVQNLERVQ